MTSILIRKSLYRITISRSISTSSSSTIYSSSLLPSTLYNLSLKPSSSSFSTSSLSSSSSTSFNLFDNQFDYPLHTKHHQKVSKKSNKNQNKLTQQNIEKEKEKNILKSKDNFQCVTFYKLKNIPQTKFQNFIQRANEILQLKRYRIYGTLLISPEGINAQFTFPSKNLHHFFNVMREIDQEFFDDIEESKCQFSFNTCLLLYSILLNHSSCFCIRKNLF